MRVVLKIVEAEQRFDTGQEVSVKVGSVEFVGCVREVVAQQVTYTIGHSDGLFEYEYGIEWIPGSPLRTGKLQ